MNGVSHVTYRDLKHQSMEDLRSFIGQQVTVIMDWDVMDAEASGLLLFVSDEGEARVKDDDGLDHFVWPTLAVIPREGHTQDEHARRLPTG